MSFDDFIVDEKLSVKLCNFENTWEYENDTKLRRAAFKAFSNKLREYQNTVATCYQYHVQGKKSSLIYVVLTQYLLIYYIIKSR